MSPKRYLVPQAPGGSMMPIDQHMSVQNGSIRLRIRDVGDEPDIHRIHVLEMLQVDARNVDAVLDIIVIQQRAAAPHASGASC